jgi:hypothetical protein
MRFVAMAGTIESSEHRLLVDVPASTQPRVVEHGTQSSGFACDSAEDRLAWIPFRATIRDFVRKNSRQHASHDHPVLAGPHQLV